MQGRLCKLELGLFIAKYWIEVLFGLICAAIAWVARHYVKLIKSERKNHENEIIQTMKDGLKEHAKQMEEDMVECSHNLLSIVEQDRKDRIEADKHIEESIDKMQDGMLSIQGRNFKNDCHKLLKADHVIDLKEYEQLLADHIAYNKLGGNHEGDALFSMVEAKYKNTIGTKEHTNGILE